MLVHTGTKWEEGKKESTVGEICDCECDDDESGGGDDDYDCNDCRFVSVNYSHVVTLSISYFQ